MCGRFALNVTAPDLMAYFRLEALKPPETRYNITPGTPILNIQERTGSSRRTGESYTWGFVPSWAKEKGRAPINARGETVATNGLFRSDFRTHRSIVPASGFYEWDRSKKPRQPYFIRRRDEAPMAFAALYSVPPAFPDMTCAIITCGANPLISRIHDRQPITLPPKSFDAWLDPDNQHLGELQALLIPTPDRELLAVPVSLRVNSPTHDDPSLVDPVGAKLVGD